MSQELFTQTELLNQGAIAIGILTLQVGQQAFTTVDHHDQAAAGVVILGVGFEMAVEFVDTGGQQCDLHFRGTGIVLTACVIRNDSGLVDVFYRHDYLSHAVNGVETHTHRDKNNKTCPNWTDAKVYRKTFADSNT